MSERVAAIYRRRLSGVERYSLVINEVHQYNVNGVVEGSGAVAVDALQRAVAIAAAVNPGVRVRLKSWLGFTQWVDSGIPPEVRVEVAPDWDGCSERGADFLLRRFDAIGGGPIADIIVVPGVKTRIIFRGLHAALDGRGTMHWEQEVFRALRGEPLCGGMSTLTDFDVAVRYRKQFASTNKQVAKNAQQPEVTYIPVVPPSSQREPGLEYMWQAILVPKKINNILSKTAVFLAQYARRHGDGVVGFTVPIDFRGLRVEAQSTGNLTGYLRINVGATDTAKTVMQQIGRQLRAYVDCQTPIGANALRWIPIRYLVKKLNEKLEPLLYAVNKDLPTGGLVSIGQASLPDFSCPGFVAERLIGIPGAVGKLNVVAINQPNGTIITFSAPKNYNREGQIDNLVRNFAEVFSA